MGKYILGGIFVALLALNVAGYVYFVREIDGSTVTSKRSLAQPQPQDRGVPTR